MDCSSGSREAHCANHFVIRPHPRRVEFRCQALPAAAHLRRQGPRPRLDALLQAVQVHSAVLATRHSSGGREFIQSLATRQLTCVLIRTTIGQGVPTEQG